MGNQLYTIEVIQQISGYLNMKDTLKLANCCKLFWNILSIQREIIYQTRDQSIYNNEALLKIVYLNYQNFVINYCDISINTYPDLYELADLSPGEFDFIYDYKFALKCLPTDKVVQFSNWFELVDMIFSIGADLNRPWYF